MNSLRGFLVAVVVALTVGCTATAPRSSPWASIEPFGDERPTEPLDLPQFPTVQEGDGVIEIADRQALLIYVETAEANTEIAWEHGDQIAELRTAYNALARAGQAEYDLAELRKATLEEERRAHLWARLTDWILIAVLGLAAAN